MADEYDSPWKEIIEDHFSEFMAFFFPQAQPISTGSEAMRIWIKSCNRSFETPLSDGAWPTSSCGFGAAMASLRWCWCTLRFKASTMQTSPNACTFIIIYNYRLFDRYDESVWLVWPF
jgi:hypothetical protein